MGLAELIDLILGLFFADDRRAFIVAEALHYTLMINLLLLFLFLLLLELQTHELVLLLGNSTILDSLALQRLVLVFELLDDLLELLDTLRVGLVLLLLLLSLGR